METFGEPRRDGGGPRLFAVAPDSADALLVFQKRVEAARARL